LSSESGRIHTLRHKRKDILLKYRGGECAHCRLSYTGDNGYLFDFHHTNPLEKLFSLETTNLTRAMALLYTEADKCMILCSNCHRTEHYNLHKKKVAQRNTEVTITDKLMDKE